MPFGFRLNLLNLDVKRQNLGINALLGGASSDELSILRAKIQNYYRIIHERPLKI